MKVVHSAFYANADDGKGGVMTLPHCWEIKKCGRESGGSKVPELGECPASKAGMGHSCWVVAGTLCGDVVQGTFAEKEGNCLACEVYRRYNRANGTDKGCLMEAYPDEQEHYQQVLRDMYRYDG